MEVKQKLLTSAYFNNLDKAQNKTNQKAISKLNIKENKGTLVISEKRILKYLSPKLVISLQNQLGVNNCLFISHYYGKWSANVPLFFSIAFFILTLIFYQFQIILALVSLIIFLFSIVEFINVSLVISDAKQKVRTILSQFIRTFEQK